jgi:mannosylglycerate hydrolase MGH1-like protein
LRRGSAAFAVTLLLALACREGPPPPPTPRPPFPEAGYSRETAWITGDAALDGLQDRLRPTLEANRKEFAGVGGIVHGFGAGDVYPQIWLRDSATLIPATRHFYPLDHLTSWLEEHLRHQRADGQLWDWIAAGETDAFRTNAPRVVEIARSGAVVLAADKNTTASDQETSAIDAAGQIFRITGDQEWLRKDLGGRRLVDRLEAALQYVEREKTGRGLVQAALTADWGDVSPAWPDQRAIYLDEKTPRVESLYASTLFVRASDALREAFAALGETARAERWRRRSAAVRTEIRERLWREDAGFFRVSRRLPGPSPSMEHDESDQFALGGNGLAVLYGVADEAQAARIFDTAEERQRRYGVSTVAGVLLPPFPPRFFPHPIQSEAWQYQNGGQWDWWAGRYLLAAFERGDAERAQRQLRDIAARVARTGGLFEWETREGRGRGSSRYAGSAGALAAAVFQGLFGIDSGAAGLTVSVRLGGVTGAVRTYEPALDRYVVYRYDYDPEAGAAHLRFESNAPGTGPLRLRLPEGTRAVGLALDGSAVPFTQEETGSDRYVVLSTSWAPHRLEMRVGRSLQK